MKKKIIHILWAIFIFICFINLITLADNSLSSKEDNLFSLKASFAQSESGDDERNVPEACVIPCPGGGSAGGDMVYCMTGFIDCTPNDCDAKCGTEV